MKKFLAVALVGLMAASAQALEITLVARSGPNAYTSGVPSLLNGNIGTNAAGGGLHPSAGGPGITVGVSGTARMGVVIRLMGGTYNEDGNVVVNNNQLSTAIVFLNQQALGNLGAVDVTGVSLTATNDLDNPWGTCNSSTGMAPFFAGCTYVGPGAPLIENAHLITFDDVPSGGGGGNSFGDNRTFLHSEFIVHGIAGHVGEEARVTFDTSLSEFFNEASQQYGFQATAAQGHGGSTTFRGGYWVPINGAKANNAFPIEVTIPEPATLSLLVIGAAAMLRRRVK